MHRREDYDMARTRTGLFMILLAVCSVFTVARPLCAAVLSDEEMSLLSGGGSHACAVWAGPCENTQESMEGKEVGDECWRCVGGHASNVGCEPTDLHLLCRAHVVSNWCGDQQKGMVSAYEPEFGGHGLYCGSTTGTLGTGCPGFGDPVNWCPQ